MSIAWPRTTSTTFGKQLQTKHCLSSAIHYVNTKREIEGKSTDDTTAANVIERLIEIVNKRGFINLTEPLLEAHISLLEVVKKEKKKKNPGEKALSKTAQKAADKMEQNHSDYEYEDISRFLIFNSIAKWTKDIPYDKVTEGSLRKALAYEGTTLDKNTTSSVEKIGEYLFTDWKSGNEKSPVSTCKPSEIKFIVDIATKTRGGETHRSNLSKDLKFRKFILKHLIKVKSLKPEELASINSTLQEATEYYTPPEPSDADIININNLFSGPNPSFQIQKRPCGICHICKIPIYIYRIVHLNAGAQDDVVELNTCGEMEHVYPPGVGSLLGTISATHEEMEERLQLAAPRNGGQRGGEKKAKNAKIITAATVAINEKLRNELVGFGLRGSHAWCNKIKKGMIFVMITMSDSIILEPNNVRIDAFKKGLIENLTSPIQLPWNYELQFKSDLDSGTVVALNSEKLYPNPNTTGGSVTYAELMTRENFASKCSDNITNLMTEFIKAASTISNNNAERFKDVKYIPVLIKVRILMNSIKYWSDSLRHADKKGFAVYEAMWNKYILPSTMSGGKYKQKGGVDINELTHELDAYIDNMDELISSEDNVDLMPTTNRNKQECSDDSQLYSDFDEALNTLKKNGATVSSSSASTAAPFTYSLGQQQMQPQQFASFSFPSAAASAASSSNRRKNQGTSGVSQQYASPFGQQLTPQQFGQQQFGQQQMQPQQFTSFSFPSAAASSAATPFAAAPFGQQMQPQQYAPFSFSPAVASSVATPFAAAPFGQQMQPATPSNSSTAVARTSSQLSNNPRSAKRGKIGPQGGSRKHRNHHSHQTRKQKRNKKTRKNKKLTKRF